MSYYAISTNQAGLAVSDSGTLSITATGYKPSGTTLKTQMECKDSQAAVKLTNIFDVTVTDNSGGGGAVSCSMTAASVKTSAIP
jgi:hypothetical protein